jgi:hypothetical protein
MRRWVVGLLFLLVAVPARGQTYVFNPTAVEFEHEDVDWNITISYTFEIWNEAETIKFYEFSVPKASVETIGTGPTRRVAATLFPPPAIGTTYRIRAIANGDCSGTPCPSPPSNYAPEFVRYSACFNTVTRRNEPVVVRMTGPSSVQVGTYYPLVSGMLTITGPNKVTSLSIEALGDGYPAFYYTMEDARSGPLPVIGPFRRVGTFSLMIKAVDDRGCEGFQATPFPRITVTP